MIDFLRQLGKFCLLIVIITFYSLTIDAKTIIVNNDGMGNYTTVQSAIDHAEPGDTIKIASGTYNEPLSIDKKLILKGEGSEETQITYNGKNLVCYAQNADELELLDLSLSYTGSDERSVLWIDKSKKVKLENCTISGGFYSGLYITADSEVELRDCRIEENDWIGIRMTDSTVHLIDSSIAGNHQHGIRISKCKNVTIENSLIENNHKDGIQVLIHSEVLIVGTLIRSNKANGIFVGSESKVTVRSNRIEDNFGNGLLFDNQSGGEVSKSLIIGNKKSGVTFRHASNPRIDHNTIVSNNKNGIYITKGTAPTIENNIIAFNRVGIVSDSLVNLPDKSPQVNYNNVWQEAYPNYQNISAPATDLSVDPMFVSREKGNYRLHKKSPMIGGAKDESDLGAFQQRDDFGKQTLKLLGVNEHKKHQNNGNDVLQIIEDREQPYFIEAGNSFKLKIPTNIAGRSVNVNSLPDGASYDSVSRLFEWTPNQSELGEMLVTFTMTDDPENPVSYDVKLFVWRENSVPRITHINGKAIDREKKLKYSVRETETLRLTFTAQQSGEKVPKFSFIFLPLGAKANNNILSWKPSRHTVPKNATNEFPILVTASNGHEVDAIDLTLTVYDMNLRRK